MALVASRPVPGEARRPDTEEQGPQSCHGIDRLPLSWTAFGVRYRTAGAANNLELPGPTLAIWGDRIHEKRELLEASTCSAQVLPMLLFRGET